MAFDFKKSLIKVQGGRTYLPVSARIVWFREEHPDWGIHTEAVEINHEKQYAVFRATIYNAEGKVMAMGTKKEDVKGFGDYIEKAECVPLSTRILTAEGWKTHDELRLGEMVAGYNVEADRLEWVPLLAVRQYQDAPVVRMANGKGFDVVCTPDHKWAVKYRVIVKGKRYEYRKLRETGNITKACSITTSALAPGGCLPVTPQQAFIMGMLITDGSLRYHGKHIRGYICQAKPAGIMTIREHLDGVPHTESVTPAHTHTFPTGKTYDCRVGYRWHPAASYLHELHDAFGIEHETELPYVVAGLSQEARTAMLDAMMLAGGDKRGNFSQMPGRNDWVIDVWTMLCALEGSTVCKAVVRETCGGIWTARRKKIGQVWASNVVTEDAGRADVWCPQTPLGTWVARFNNDVVAITGNTGAVGRALALCGFGTQFSPELDEVGGGRLADSPYPVGGNRYGGGGGGNNYAGGGSRYGNNGGGYTGGNAPNGGGNDGSRFSPPREVSAPREAAPPPVHRDEPPARAAQESAPRPSAAPEVTARPAPSQDNSPRRPAPVPVTPDDDDDFEALISSGGDIIPTSEDDPFGDDAPLPTTGTSSATVKAASATGDGNTAPAGHPACVGCGKALTKAQQDLSIRNYGEALCPGCQKDKGRAKQPAMANR